MAVIFVEGFDKYGPAGIGNGATNLSNLLTASEWSALVTGSQTFAPSIVAPLSSTGQALNLNCSSSAGGGSYLSYLSKNLPGNYTTLIGGFRFCVNTWSTQNWPLGIAFCDGTSAQCAIRINQTTGTISLTNGNTNGTALATSTASVTLNSTHYLEFQISFSTSGTGSYQVWLDGQSIMTGSAKTANGTSNAYANNVRFEMNNPGTQIWTLDDFYLFDNTGATNNAPLLSNPRVETQYPAGDAVPPQFTSGALLLGQAYSATGSTNNPGGNVLMLRRFVPVTNCTLNSVSGLPQSTNGSANFKAVLYADNAGVPGALVATGAQVTGAYGGSAVTSAFASGQALTAGTPVWIGFITDTGLAWYEVDGALNGYVKSNTYSASTNNPPAAPTGFTTGQPNWVIYGNCTAGANNWPSLTDNPPLQGLTWVGSSTVGNEDLYNFAALSVTPQAIYTVAVKAYAAKTDGGARTLAIHMSSNGHDATGSAPLLYPPTSYAWLTSYFDTNPNNGSAWDGPALNAATSGPGIAS